MSDDPVAAAGAIIMEATGRSTLKDAVAWLGEDHPMAATTDWSSILRALVAVTGAGAAHQRALRRVVREATTSDVDTARVIFDLESIPRPGDVKAALEALLSRSADGTFGGLTAKGVMRAQLANPFAVDVLCLAAGVPAADAAEWFRTGSTWRQADAEDLLEYLRALIAGEIASPFANAEPARGVEHLASDGGWALADKLRADGVPYELFLLQRAVGGAWLAHKNRTSSFSNIAAAAALCELLRARNIDFRRSTIVGGTAKQLDLQQLSGVADKRVGLVVVAEGSARYAVGFSTARDGGTARANGDGLLQIPVGELPYAFVLTGPGWNGRPETDRLALRFAGRLYTDKTLNHLVHDIESQLT